MQNSTLTQWHTCNGTHDSRLFPLSAFMKYSTMMVSSSRLMAAGAFPRCRRADLLHRCETQIGRSTSVVGFARPGEVAFFSHLGSIFSASSACYSCTFMKIHLVDFLFHVLNDFY